MGQYTESDYNVFVSYSHVDQAWVHGELLPRLERAKLKVAIDFRVFRPGAPIVEEMERAVRTSQKTVLVLTPAYLTSAWAEFEALMLATLDPANRELRLIPLLKEECLLPLRIRYLTYVNFVNPTDPTWAWTQLLAALGSSPESESQAVVAQCEAQRPIVQLDRRWNELVKGLREHYSLAPEYEELSCLVDTLTKELQGTYPSERELDSTTEWQRVMVAIRQFCVMSSQHQQLRNHLRDMKAELAQAFLRASERSHNQQKWREALLLSKQALALDPNSNDARNIQEYAAEALKRKSQQW
jgi:hypothetical protein